MNLTRRNPTHALLQSRDSNLLKRLRRRRRRRHARKVPQWSSRRPKTTRRRLRRWARRHKNHLRMRRKRRQRTTGVIAKRACQTSPTRLRRGRGSQRLRTERCPSSSQSVYCLLNVLSDLVQVKGTLSEKTRVRVEAGLKQRRGANQEAQGLLRLSLLAFFTYTSVVSRAGMRCTQSLVQTLQGPRLAPANRKAEADSL